MQYSLGSRPLTLSRKPPHPLRPDSNNSTDDNSNNRNHNRNTNQNSRALNLGAKVLAGFLNALGLALLVSQSAALSTPMGFGLAIICAALTQWLGFKTLCRVRPEGKAHFSHVWSYFSFTAQRQKHSSLSQACCGSLLVLRWRTGTVFCELPCVFGLGAGCYLGCREVLL